MVNVVTLCSGYDSQCLALERLKRFQPSFTYDLVAWAEIDKYAITAHNALFPQWIDRNIGDITSCDWSQVRERVDLLTYSTPCQSISAVGRMEGLEEGSGTKSSIIWSVLSAIDTLKPKVLLMENVKNLVSKRFIGDFHAWCKALEDRGYTNFAQILDAADYGVPQHRERVFMVSLLDADKEYIFPQPFQLNKRFKDLFEKNVDDKYYLSEKGVAYMHSVGGKNKTFKRGGGVTDGSKVAATLPATYNKIQGASPFISDERGVRKLTEREAFRIMDVEENDIDKLLNCGLSQTRLYQVAGNSIVVSCLYYIFKALVDQQIIG